MSQFYKLTIKEIIKETKNAVIIGFEVPNNLKQTFKFKAGQYITLKAKINGEDIRRDYSICSSPKSGELKVAVKAVESGIFSKFANNTLKAGESLEVLPPNGRFILDPNPKNTRTVVAFAAGSGITPVMSILKTVLQEEPKSDFILVYGNKTPSDTIFYDELKTLHVKYKERLKIQFVFSQSQEQDALFGRIDRSILNYTLKNLQKNTIADTYYICGPEAMIYAVSDVLKDQGVPENKIKFELFTVTASSEANLENLKSGQTRVTIMLDDEESSFVMDNKNSVLEAALAEKLDAPYSCQGGICSTCMARLKEGNVTMTQNHILTDDELEEGFILTCQSHPTTPTIYVDYDDI